MLSDEEVQAALSSGSTTEAPAPYPLYFPGRPGQIGWAAPPDVRIARWAHARNAEGVTVLPAELPSELRAAIVVFELNLVRIPEGAGPSACGDGAEARLLTADPSQVPAMPRFVGGLPPVWLKTRVVQDMHACVLSIAFTRSDVEKSNLLFAALTVENSPTGLVGSSTMADLSPRARAAWRRPASQ